MRICPACGGENKDTGKFCIHCGTSLPPQEVPAVNTDPLDTDFIRPEAEEQAEYVPAEPVYETPEAEPFSEPAPEAPFFSEPAPQAEPETVPAAPAAPAASVRPAVPGYDRRQLRLKDVLRSGKSRKVAICFSILLVLSILFSVTPVVLSRQIGDLANEFIGSLPIDEYANEIAEAVQKATGGEYTFVFPDSGTLTDGVQKVTGVSVITSIFKAVLNNVLPVLTVISLWMIYASANRNDVPCCKTTGLTIIKVIEILKLIGTCLLLMVAVLAFILAGYFSAGISGAETERIGSSILSSGITFGVIFLLVILFQAGVIRSLSIFTAVAEGRAYRGKVSLYAAVIFRVKGVLNILTALGAALLTVIPLFSPDVRFLSLIGAALLIPSLISIFKYFALGGVLKQARKALAD